uniref:Uncharacterized protein n=1 Tax=Tanacetum cinerariifolium TaxID=118510 RepID=A0A6L2KUU2_TANCI|nr:hypothetical protein [Tanacetum cinerariifolium]
MIKPISLLEPNCSSPDTKEHIQLTVKGSYSPLDEGTRKSNPLLKEKQIDGKDSEGNKQPTDMVLLAIIISKTKPLPEGTKTNPKDSKRIKTLIDTALSTPLTEHNIGLWMILENLREVQDAVKEDQALNKKVLTDVEAYTNNSTTLTELLTLEKNFNFPGLTTIIESLNAVVTA